MTFTWKTTEQEIKAAASKDLLAFYNGHSGKPAIKKFSDRASAERRCIALLSALPKPKATVPTSTPNPVVAAALNPANMVTHIVVIRDHSGSMGTLCDPAMRDFNNWLASTKRAAEKNGIRTNVTVIECGGSGQYGIKETLARPIADVPHITSYRASGGTPLFLSVIRAAQILQSVPDYNNPEATFMVLATTDGHDTDGGVQKMTQMMQQLQATDRWTFAFRVPKGYKRDLVNSGVHPGNILEWDQTEKGMAAASAASDQAMDAFYTARAAGTKSSRTFYTSTANVTEAEVKQKLGDISAEVSLWPIAAKEDGAPIREFVEGRLKGAAMLKGGAFYQLVKVEEKIQDYKLIAIRDKDSGAIYCGPEARSLVGLPEFGDARVRPDTAGKWQVFVQSTSVNRKVTGGTQLMYWPNVGRRFVEGKSARP